MTTAPAVRLHREVAGEGSPVVLVHSGIGDGRMWDPQWNAFQREHRVVRFDLAGFGRTPLEPGTYTPPGDVIALLDELALGPVALVGASLGGGISLQVAVARPELVSALVLVGTGVRGHEWSEWVRRGWAEEEAALERGDIEAAVETTLRTWVVGPKRAPDAVDPALRERIAEMRRLALEHRLRRRETAHEQALVLDVGDRLGEIAAPTLVVVGEDDVSDIHDVAERLSRELQDVRVARIANAAHLPSLERPEEFNELVLDFLREVEG